MRSVSTESGLLAATQVSEQEVAGFAADALAAFAEAARASGLIEEWFDIAGQCVRVRLAGPALEEYALPALAHHRLPTPGGEADLSISVFDTRSTGVQMPRPVWPKTAYAPTCEIAGIDGDRFLAAFNVGTGTFDLLDTAKAQAIHWIADADEHPAFEASAPFRIILHWWMRGRGVQFLHGGAVGTQRGAVLLAGKGGTGKSTTALACLAGGMKYVSDDYVLVGRSPTPVVHNLYQTGKLNVEEVRERFPELEEAILGYTDPAGLDKVILLLADRYPQQVVNSLPLVAVVIPRVTGAAIPALHAASEDEALQAIVPSSVRQLVAVRRQDLDFTAELARRLPAYTLEFGPNMDRVPGVIRGLLAEV
jgi:hypothetical protein